MRKKKENWSEKRKFIRIDAHHLLKYKIIGKEKALSFAGNISAGGVLFYTKEYIHPESVVELTINFPSYPGPIKAVSRVVRIRPMAKVGGFEVGAEFVEIAEDAREFINKRILKAQK
ncbi:MAG: PilZ domain-containing protein [Candidatus Omnitrophota bacterium]